MAFPSVGEHRRSDGLLLMLMKFYFASGRIGMALWCARLRYVTQASSS